MRLKRIIKHFRRGNCLVYGLRGDGKDMLTANVVVRRKLPYISNVDYGGKWFPFEPDKLDCGKNDYRNFLNGNINPYTFPYPDGTDVYVSDAGVYFPAQYCNELNRDYKYLATYQALSRHVGLSNFHANSQSCTRVYDKIREQMDTFILCRFCIYIPFVNIVVQGIRIYDQYDSAVAKRRPYAVRSFACGRQARMANKIAKQQHLCTYGYIKNGILIYRNKSKYDTRIFKTILKGDTLET